jgi:hypothetical protein
MSLDMTTDTTTATRWETYAEAGRRLGITPEAVRAHAKRQKWQRQRPNSDPHGPVLVEVPADFRPLRVVGGHDPGQSTVMTEAIEALRDALAMFEGRADRAEARADRADADRRAAEATAAAAVLEAEKGRAAALKEVEQLREAEAARKARGRLARLRAAWRG